MGAVGLKADWLQEQCRPNRNAAAQCFLAPVVTYCSTFFVSTR